MSDNTFAKLLNALDVVSTTVLEKKAPNSIYEFNPPFDDRAFFERLAKGYLIDDKITSSQQLFGPLLKRNTVQLKVAAEILRGMHEGGAQRYLVLKNRKVGISTFAEILGAELCTQLFRWESAVIAHTKPSAEKLFKTARTAVDRLPLPMAKPLRYNSIERIEWGNPEKHERQAGNHGHEASFYAQSAAGEHPLSGHTVRYLHMSECAKFDSVGDIHAQRAFILSALGSIPKNGPSLVIAESTANGTSGWFYETWRQAIESRRGNLVEWKPIFVCWLDDPACVKEVPSTYQWSRWMPEDIDYERMLVGKYNASKEQLFFRRIVMQQEMGGDPTLFEQEYPLNWQSAFISSGSPAIPRRAIAAQMQNVVEEYDHYEPRLQGRAAPVIQMEVDA